MENYAIGNDKEIRSVHNLMSGAERKLGKIRSVESDKDIDSNFRIYIFFATLKELRGCNSILEAKSLFGERKKTFDFL